MFSHICLLSFPEDPILLLYSTKNGTLSLPSLAVSKRHLNLAIPEQKSCPVIPATILGSLKTRIKPSHAWATHFQVNTLLCHPYATCPKVCSP